MAKNKKKLKIEVVPVAQVPVPVDGDAVAARAPKKNGKANLAEDHAGTASSVTNAGNARMRGNGKKDGVPKRVSSCLRVS